MTPHACQPRPRLDARPDARVCLCMMLSTARQEGTCSTSSTHITTNLHSRDEKHTLSVSTGRPEDHKRAAPSLPPNQYSNSPCRRRVRQVAQYSIQRRPSTRRKHIPRTDARDETFVLIVPMCQDAAFCGRGSSHVIRQQPCAIGRSARAFVRRAFPCVPLRLG